MTDTGPVTDLGDGLTRGQRRLNPGQPFPERPEPTGPVDPDTPTIEDDPGLVDPCANPETALEWNADAAAAQTVKDLKSFATQTHPLEANFNDREYGAALWEMPDGSVVHGPMTFAELTFLEVQTQGAPGGRGSVGIDLASPAPGAVFLGTVHTHNMGSTRPSGNSYANGDQGVLSNGITLRESQRPGSGDQARMYIAANDPGEYETMGPTRMRIYNKTNRDAAMGEYDGPEVNPDGQPCGAQ